MSFVSNVYTNITMISTSLLFMVILLIGILSQKRELPTTRALTSLTILEIFILIGQISQRYLYVISQNGEGTSLTGFIDNILFCIDFSLMYFSLIAFFKFVKVLIEDTASREGIEATFPDWLSKLLISWSSVFCIIFTIAMLTNSIMVFDEHGIAHIVNAPMYFIISRTNFLIYLVCAISIIKYAKVLRLFYCIILLSYIFARFFMITLDLIYDTSFTYIFLAIEIFILYLGIDRRRTIDLITQEIMIFTQKAEIEEKNTQIMVSQIQPHFLYNTLSVIDYLCGKDPEMARTAINKFSEYLRTNMESIGSSTPVAFEQELRHTKTYLWIEELRFPDILKVKYDIEYTDFSIPPLSLQPLVENAVKHGVRGKEEGGTVVISTKKYKDKIYIYVVDDGIGFDTNSEPNDERIHVGIDNVKSRIKLICDGELNITSIPGTGTTATIILNIN